MGTTLHADEMLENEIADVGEELKTVSTSEELDSALQPLVVFVTINV